MSQPDVPPAEPPAERQQPTSLDPDWSGAAGVPAVPVNQMVVQLGDNTGVTGAPDGVYLTVGHAPPPILVGSAENVQSGLSDLDGKLRVNVHGRYFLTRERLEELKHILQQAADQFDAVTEAVAEERGGGKRWL